MARIKNDLFKLTGSLGGLSFSQDEKGTIVKQKATVSKDRIMTHPKSQGTRDNMMEFGAASKAAKVLRLAFVQNRKGISDRYFSGRLIGAMRLVVGLGEGLRGKRKLDIRKNGGLLEGVEFINARPLVSSIGGIKEKPTLNAERNEVSWTTPALTRKEQITAPDSASHFRFILGAGTISNYEYNTVKKEYLPSEPKYKSICFFVESKPISLKQKTIQPLTLSLRHTEDMALPEEVAVVCVVGVIFYRNVNGELLEITDAGGMRVLGVG